MNDVAINEKPSHFGAGSGFGFEINDRRLHVMKNGDPEFHVALESAAYDGLTLFSCDQVTVDIGDDEVTIRTTAASPATARDKIADAMHAAGIDSVRYDSDGCITLTLAFKNPSGIALAPGLRYVRTGEGAFIYLTENANDAQKNQFAHFHQDMAGDPERPHEVFVRKL